MRWPAVCLLILSWNSSANAADLQTLPTKAPEKPHTSSQGFLCGGFFGAKCSPSDYDRRHLTRSAVWGFVEVPAYLTGTRMAPNGIYFDPLFSLKGNFNIELVPDKKLYVFNDTNVWMQRAQAGITNSSQGRMDFSKREFDFNAGVAWNYLGNSELRLSAYSLGNLNRGQSLSAPSGFKDGVSIENRYYFGSADKYDVGRLSFIGLGFYPTKSMVGGNGEDFHPGLFANAYLTYDLPFLNSYLYGGAKYTAERYFQPRLLEVDGGLALRPFESVKGAEIRFGSSLTADIQDKVARDLLYSSFRINY